MSIKVSKSTLTIGQVIIIIIMFLTVPVALFLNYNWLVYCTDTQRGTMGDLFGVANAAFTGLAFAGLVVNIILQRNDLKSQKEENARIRQEAEDQKEAAKLEKIVLEAEAEEQKAVLQIQRFETTFFNMLNLHNEIVKNIKYQGSSGREVFDDAYKKLLIMLLDKNAGKIFKITANTEESITTIPTDLSDAKKKLESKYFPGYYNEFASALNHYFRHLYHIFKFIYFSELSVKDKQFYASLCRAQLSQNELLAISFNILIDWYGKPKFLYLVKEYDILQNFDNTVIQPHLYWNLIEQEIREVKYPFTDKEKPTNRVID